ncbi:MAG: GGDEF domain-containing protein [bacterium]|nr:GGDEF domain-containing protein [bacterium]
MEKRKELSGVVSLLLASVFLIGAVILTSSHAGIDPEHYEMLNQGWTVTINGAPCSQTQMDSLVFPLVNRGDEVVLETTLPARNIDNPILVFYSVHSTLRVELDGNEIFRYGQERYEAGRLVGYGYQCINLPEGYEGKRLSLKLDVCEDAAFSSFDTPQLYDANWYVKDYLKENLIPLIINLFLIVFGICVIGVAVIFLVRLRSLQWLKLLWVALFSIGIGGWSLCSYNLTFLFSDSLARKVFVEFALLYLLPIPVFAYFYAEAVHTESRVRKGVYAVIMILQMVFSVTAFALQLTGVCHFPKLLRYQHVLIGLMALYLIGMFISDIRRKRLESAVLFAGAIIMIFFAASDLLRFNIEKYVSMSSGRRYVGMFSIGVMIFITAMLLDFSRSVTRALYDAAKGEALAKLAYSDALTGLANRRSCEDKFDELDAAGEEKSYVIGVFDLNNLKQVNDKLGHEEGDAFIRTFGGILREVFASKGLVGRTGGDEFLVVLDDVSAGEIEELIGRMQALIAEQNQVHKNWNLSTAYGISEHTKEPGKSVRELYKLADARMYECKKEMKKKSVSGQ